MKSKPRPISLKEDLTTKIEALGISDNRNFSNVCETILYKFFEENPNAKTIIEARFKHRQLVNFLNDYNDKLLDRWTSGSKQDFTEFVTEYLSKNDLQLEPKPNKYSEKDMKEFADWCRNALLNTEYSLSRLNSHLKDWKKIKEKAK